MKIVTVIGAPRATTTTVVAAQYAAQAAKDLGAELAFIDLRLVRLPLFELDGPPLDPALRALVEDADAYILATPDFHGTMSGALKNFLDHCWHEFAGKLFGIICTSHDKGLTTIDHIRTVVRQCYGWSLPYGVAVQPEEVDEATGEIAHARRLRLDMFSRDLVRYGSLISQQRTLDLLHPTEPTFMDRYRQS